MPDLEQAAKSCLQEAKVFSRLGAAWSGQKRMGQSGGKLFKGHSKSNTTPGLSRPAGRLTGNSDKLDNAIADFQQSVELDPKNAQAYAELCDIYLDKDDPQTRDSRDRQGR